MNSKKLNLTVSARFITRRAVQIYAVSWNVTAGGVTVFDSIEPFSWVTPGEYFLCIIEDQAFSPSYDLAPFPTLTEKKTEIFQWKFTDGISCKVTYEEALPNTCIWRNAQIFNHMWGGRKSYMTLHPIPSKHPYKWGKFYFLFYQRSPLSRQQVGSLSQSFSCVSPVELKGAQVWDIRSLGFSWF